MLVFNEPWFLVFWAVCEDSLVFLAINICLRVLSSSLKDNILFLLFCSTMRCFFYHHRQLENFLAFSSAEEKTQYPETLRGDRVTAKSQQEFLLIAYFFTMFFFFPILTFILNMIPFTFCILEIYVNLSSLHDP